MLKKRVEIEKKALAELFQRKGKGSEIKAPQYMLVNIGSGQVSISDYSHGDDYKIVLAMLGSFGMEPNVSTESWCG